MRGDIQAKGEEGGGDFVAQNELEDRGEKEEKLPACGLRPGALCVCFWLSLSTRVGACSPPFLSLSLSLSLSHTHTHTHIDRQK